MVYLTAQRCPREKYLKPLREKYNIIEYVGIAADEQFRLERKRNKSANHVHPLIEWGMTEADCLNYCYEKGYDLLTILLYVIIVFAVLYVSAALGAAMDLSVDDEGVLDFSLLMTQFEAVLTNTDTVWEHLTDFSGYSAKITIMVSFALGIYALLKATSKKRLHRKGVEHGSARWANEKEEKFLADKSEKKKSGKPAKAEKPKSPFETDNNILLTQEVRMSLNTRQHRENLNVLVIGGSGSGKSRFYVKPNIMQLNTSYVVTDPKGELLRSCGKLLQKAGYEIRVFNLIDMSHSNNYNPFNYVYDKNGEMNKTYVNELNSMFSMLIELLTNDSLLQTTTASLPNLMSAIKATALTLCVMFFLIDFFTKSLHLQWVTWENVLMLFLKLVAAKVCVDNAELFTTMLYRGFNSFINAISGTITQYSFITGDDLTKAQYFVSASQASQIVNNTDAGFLNFQPILLNLQISIQGLIMKIIMILANVVVIARLFELTVYTLIAPVPLSTFACEGLSDVGKGFLKSYAAVSLIFQR